MQRLTHIVFAKSPYAHDTKTRLGSKLPLSLRQELARAMLQDTLNFLQQGHGLIHAKIHLYLGPETTKSDDLRLQPLLQGVHQISSQQGKDLNQRLFHACQEAKSHSLLPFFWGADTPNLVAADRALLLYLIARPQSAVIGPSADGGYYGLGMNPPRPELFRDVPLEHARAYAETESFLSARGYRIHRLSPLNDIDTPMDLYRLAQLQNLSKSAPEVFALLQTPRWRATLKHL